MPNVSYEYGKALYELSCELSQSDNYLLQVRQLREILSENKNIINILSSPVIPKEERLDIIDRIFEGRIEKHICTLLKLLTQRGRANIVFDCLDEFERLWYENSGTVIAEAVSAVNLTDEQLVRLHKSLEERSGKTIELRTRVDPSLIGGVRVILDGELLDGSVKGRLQRLKDDLTAHTSQ